MVRKSFFFHKAEALYNKDGTIAVTHLSNVPRPDLYKTLTMMEFAKWNKEQEDKHDWWIATAPFYSLEKIVSYFGYSLDDFKIHLPITARPIVFALGSMCFTVAPFLGYNYTGDAPTWQEQAQIVGKQETESKQ